MLGPHPIVSANTQVRVEPIEPDPEIARLRHQLGFDYGKFDKTTAAAGLPTAIG